MYAGAARAGQNHEASSHAGRLPPDHSDPATAVGQPNAAVVTASEGSKAAVQQSPPPTGSTPPLSSSAVESHTPTDSNAAVALTSDSTGQPQPADFKLSGVLATAVDRTGSTQDSEVSVQPLVQQRQEGDPGNQHEKSEPVRGLADPNKRLLAKMGSEVPADVSMQLMQEVGARSQVQGLLQVRPWDSSFCQSQ